MARHPFRLPPPRPRVCGVASLGRGRLPSRHEPLALVFRRPAEGVPPAGVRSGNGSTVNLSFHFSLRVWLAHRVTTMVRQAMVKAFSAPGRTLVPAYRRPPMSGAPTRPPARLPARKDAFRPSPAGRNAAYDVGSRSPLSGSRLVPRQRPASAVPPPNDELTASRGSRAGGFLQDAQRPASVGRTTRQPDAAFPLAFAAPTPPAARTPWRPGPRRYDRLGGQPVPVTRPVADEAAPMTLKRRISRAGLGQSIPDRPVGVGYEATPASGVRRQPAATEQLQPVIRTLRPANLVHREPARTAVVVPASVEVQPPAPTRAAALPLDLDRLDGELWKRFEKRVRIENERRGRG